MNLPTLLLVLTIASCVFWLVACWCVREFARERSAVRSHFSPPVSVLKPVSGLDHQAYANFRSFCEQDYPGYEILFGMQNADDPVLPVLDRLRREFPHLNIQVVTAEPMGANEKVSNLQAMVSAAHHDILVLSDSDMRVTPDYLRQVVEPLGDESNGLVTCLYRGEEATSLASAFEALYDGSTYMPEATVAARLIRLPVAFGSTMALRRKDLERIGGFAAIMDYLADDYELAARIMGLGKRVVLAPYVVPNILGAESWRQVWNREVRWVRCIRASRPLEYPGLLLSFTPPLAIATATVMGFDVVGRNLIVMALLVRWGTAWLISGYLGDTLMRRMLPWLPLRDLMTFAVWCAGVVSRDVEWRGRRFRVQADGRLQPLVARPLGQHRPADVEKSRGPLTGRKHT